MSVVPVPPVSSIENSTNVRTLGAVALRGAVGLAPGLATRLLVSAFLRTRPIVPTDEEAARLADGAEFAVPLDGGTVRGWTWGEGPVVYLVHGWNGHAGQLAALGQALAAAGLRAVAFDGPGHGRSSGRTSSLVHLARALEAVAAVHGPARAVVAHSLGAAGAWLAVRRGVRAERVVMVAPAADPMRYVHAVAAGYGVAELGPAFEAELARRVGYSGAEVSIRETAHLGVQPLLLVHDRRDRETPFAGSEGISARWRGSRVHATEGLGHRRILGDAGVKREIVRFVAGGAACAHGNPEGGCPECQLQRALYERG